MFAAPRIPVRAVTQDTLPGTMVLVVGPSGAGKDSLIDGARRAFAGGADVVFPRRDITRPADAGSEDHVAVTESQFHARRELGGYLLSWGAHGLWYGIPTETVDHLLGGRTVVVNASRSVIEEARGRFQHLRVVSVTADEETLRARLGARARETDAQIAAAWTDTPAETVCATCHKGEAKTFALGRHGTRRHPEIAEPRSAKSALKKLGWKKPPEALVSALDAYLTDPAPPAAMSVAEGRVPLKPEAHGETLTCSTCHAPHRQDLGFAAVGACVSCHDDDHSRAYEGSPHHLLWQAELAGDLPPGSGVTCATCHMPKTKSAKAITTNHNQNDTLRPNEKMIRPVCAECHGLGFAIDALADPALIANNFSGQPDRHVESIDWAVNRVEPPEQGTNQ